MRQQYLIHGNANPMGHLELLAFGYAIVRKGGAPMNITWIDDCQALTLGNQRVSMHGFRLMVWETLREAHDSLCPLMFGWQPAMDLGAIQDNLVASELASPSCGSQTIGLSTHSSTCRPGLDRGTQASVRASSGGRSASPNT